jgi:hypothetical protein
MSEMFYPNAIILNTYCKSFIQRWYQIIDVTCTKYIYSIFELMMSEIKIFFIIINTTTKLTLDNMDIFKILRISFAMVF